MRAAGRVPFAVVEPLYGDKRHMVVWHTYTRQSYTLRRQLISLDFMPPLTRITVSEGQVHP